MTQKLELDQERVSDKPKILSMEQFKPLFDKKLIACLEGEIQELYTISANSPLPKYMEQHKEAFGRDGKRVRELIAYTMYSGLGGKDIEKALDAFVPLEIFHIFCLIHDDLNDKGTIRRGKPTIQIFIADQLRRKNPKKNVNYDQIGESQAMHIGNLLSFLSQELVHSNSHLSPNEKKAMLNQFHAMAKEAALGQSIDINMATKDTTSMADIMEKIYLKTSSYTFIRPMLIGASLVGKDTDPKVNEFCKEVGSRLGRAYQMQDDLLDMIPTDLELKKTSLSDISQRQHTYFTQYVFDHGSEDQKKELNNLFDNPNQTEETRVKLLKILLESGAIKSGETLIGDNIEQAKKLINESNIIGQEAKERFNTLIDYLGRRVSATNYYRR